MNREELKKTLKPLIKQCIKEVLFEEAGVLSKVVTEVAIGLSSERPLVTEEVLTQPNADAQKSQMAEERSRALREQKDRMLKSIGRDAYNGVDIFEGTSPMSSSGAPASGGSSSSPMGPMKNIDPNDAGVDINSIPGLNMDVAKKLMG